MTSSEARVGRGIGGSQSARRQLQVLSLDVSMAAWREVKSRRVQVKSTKLVFADIHVAVHHPFHCSGSRQAALRRGRPGCPLQKVTSAKVDADAIQWAMRCKQNECGESVELSNTSRVSLAQAASPQWQLPQQGICVCGRQD